MAVTVSSLPSVIVFPSPNTLPASGAERCAFTRTRERWTLQADCELSTALDLPPHVTLDGAGHTMTLTGDAESFESAAIRATGGDIVNLTVDGSQLLPLLPAYFAAITLAAPGHIARTTVRNVHFGDAPHTAIGIEVAAFGGVVASVQDTTLENISGAGLLLTGDSQVTVERVSSSGVTAAVQVNGAVSVRISHAEVEPGQVGVLAQDQSRVRILASGSTGERVATDQALIHQDTLTFIGAGDREQSRRRAAHAAATSRDRLG